MISVLTSLFLIANADDDRSGSSCRLVIPHPKECSFAKALEQLLAKCCVNLKDGNHCDIFCTGSGSYVISKGFTTRHSLSFHLIRTITNGSHAWSTCTMWKQSWTTGVPHMVARIELPLVDFDVDRMLQVLKTLFECLARCPKHREINLLHTTEDASLIQLRECAASMDAWVKTNDALTLDVILIHPAFSQKHFVEFHCSNQFGDVVVDKDGSYWEVSRIPRPCAICMHFI